LQEYAPILNEKQQALMLLKENGLTIPEAAKALEYNTNYAYQLNSKLKKYHLTGNNKLAKSAFSVIKNCMTGTPFGSIDKIKDSTALQAASMYYDRNDPKTTINENRNININLSPIDLDTWRSR